MLIDIAARRRRHTNRWPGTTSGEDRHRVCLVVAVYRLAVCRHADDLFHRRRLYSRPHIQHKKNCIAEQLVGSSKRAARRHLKQGSTTNNQTWEEIEADPRRINEETEKVLICKHNLATTKMDAHADTAARY